MKYLTLAADYGTPSLRDADPASEDLHVADLPSGIRGEIVAWNRRYQAIIPLDALQRQAAPNASLITELDQTGIALAERLAATLPDDAKVRYYSEGLLRHLT